jgi:hypothetical protein
MICLCILLVSLFIGEAAISLGQDRRSVWLKRMSRSIFSHRTVCVALVIIAFTTFGTSSVQLYVSDPLSKYGSNPSQTTASFFVWFCTLTTSLSTGLMRRGPRLYYQVPSAKLGSGLQAVVQEETEGLRLWLAGKEHGIEPEANVLDYDECGILPLLTGAYVST